MFAFCCGRLVCAAAHLRELVMESGVTAPWWPAGSTLSEAASESLRGREAGARGCESCGGACLARSDRFPQTHQHGVRAPGDPAAASQVRMANRAEHDAPLSQPAERRMFKHDTWRLRSQHLSVEL